MVWLGFLSIAAITVLIGTLIVSIEPIQEAEASEPFIGEIKWVGFNFAPRSWAFCEGQLLPISSNTALFSLLGTTFGGDGRTTFGLPDLRGRTMVGVGTGPGLDNIRWGERGGNDRNDIAHMPAHSHTLGPAVLQGTPIVGDSVALSGNALSLTFARAYSTTSPTAQMHTNSIAGTTDSVGQSQDKRDPYLGLHCTIALTGIFPSRS